MGVVGDLYLAGRTRITEVMRDVDDATAGSTTVPTCPAWSVHDVLAHVVGIPTDILAGNVEGAASDPWTAAQVDARRDATIADLLAEWDANAPQVEAIVDDFGPTGVQLLFDLTTHEHDIRLALGLPPLRDLPAHLAVTGFVFTRLAGGEALRVVAQEGTFVLGEGEPTATLTAPLFDVLRAMSGRRSEAQIRAMQWEGDPTPHLGKFAGGPFTMPVHDIAEG
jgi:uncharacterized protein (TIGR03083 family)